VIVTSEELREKAAHIVLELGFGRGELLLDLAEANPERSYVGVEIRRARVEKVAKRAEKRGIANVLLLHAPAEYALERVLPEGCVDECWINCPDPWPKKRHWRRRLIQAPFVALLARAMAKGAILHIATDHPGYRDWIAEVMAGQGAFVSLHATPWSESPPPRRETAYEAEWRAEGRTLAYFDYRQAP
jgi:tRNA (guanine-N7-)-methyltransferase